MLLLFSTCIEALGITEVKHYNYNSIFCDHCAFMFYIDLDFDTLMESYFCPVCKSKIDLSSVKKKEIDSFRMVKI